MTILMRTTKSSFDRRALATQAMQAAIATRARAKLDQHGPICIYGLSETLGVTVRFNNINMEGMYQRGVPPRIHLSARHPAQQRPELALAQRIVIVQILVAQRQAQHARRHQHLHRMPRPLRLAVIPETGAQPAEQPRPLRQLPQQQSATI